MTTTLTAPRAGRHYLTPSSPAQWAYAAGSAIAAVGLLGIPVLGTPSFTFGHLIMTGFVVACLIGAALERDMVTAMAVALGGLAANYVIVTSTHDRTYSHTTLAAQFLAIVGVVLLVAVTWNRKRTAR